MLYRWYMYSSIHIIGFEQLVGLKHIDASFPSGEKWNDSPKVVNGASDLFLELLEEKSKHTRAILGVEKLPGNFCVVMTASFTIKTE